MTVDIPADQLERIQNRLRKWAVRLHALGLCDIADSLLGAAEPLGSFGAQLLWVAQPALNLLMPADEINALARLLDDPAGLAWLREELTGYADSDAHRDAGYIELTGDAKDDASQV